MTRRYFVQRLLSYPEAGKTALISAAQGRQLKVYGCYVANRAGASQDVGIAKLLALQDNALVGTVSDASAPDLTDQTAAFIAGSSVDVFTTVADDGFLVQAKNPFHLIGLTLTQAATGSPVYAYEYFNGAAFVAIPMLATPNLTTIGDKLFLFAGPPDWAVGGPAGVGVTAGMYAIRIRATTAGGQAVKANATWVGELLAFQGDMPNNGVLGFSSPYEAAELLESRESLIPYYSVPSANNFVTVRYFREG